MPESQGKGLKPPKVVYKLKFLGLYVFSGISFSNLKLTHGKPLWFADFFKACHYLVARKTGTGDNKGKSKIWSAHVQINDSKIYSFPNTLDKFYHMYNVMRHIGKTLPLSSNEFLWIPVGSLECPIKMVMNFKRCEVWLLYSFVYSESGSQNLTT